MTIRIIPCTTPTELYHAYPGRDRIQPAYVELDLREHTLLADYDSAIEGGAPGAVRTGIERRYAVPILTADAATELLHTLAPIAERIADDTTIQWDGNNMRAMLGPDALAAEKELTALLEAHPFTDDDLVSIWDVDSLTTGLEGEEYGITSETSDARLAEIEAEILADVDNGRVSVCHGLREYLEDIRSQAALDPDDL